MGIADNHTVAWIVCNPSNPCGSVYKYQHLIKIANTAEKLKVPIISDEIYAHMVFGATGFTPMAAFSLKVPVLTVGGISKRWLAPGWRVGWIIIADPKGILFRGKIVEALTRLMQMTIGTSTVSQVKIDPTAFTDITSDVEFASLLVEEESVVVLPGAAFGAPNWLRIVFASPLPLLEEAWDRIDHFCLRHSAAIPLMSYN
jgi:tyrosine aminotransferase